MKILIVIQFALFSIFVLASQNAIGDTPDFLVEMKIVNAGVEMAAPSLMVKEGTEASLSRSGEDGVSIGLVVNNVSETEAHLIVEVESGANSISPDLFLRKGEWASVSSGDLAFHVRVQHHAANK